MSEVDRPGATDPPRAMGCGGAHSHSAKARTSMLSREPQTLKTTASSRRMRGKVHQRVGHLMDLALAVGCDTSSKPSRSSDSSRARKRASSISTSRSFSMPPGRRRRRKRPPGLTVASIGSVPSSIVSRSVAPGAVLGSASMAEDHELLADWRRGDDQAGRQLVERHIATVERFFFNKVGDASADLIQQTFLRVLEARTRMRADADIRAYMLGIARNVLYEHYRRYRKDLERLDFGSQSVAEIAPTPATRIAGAQEIRLLLQGLQRIPLDHQVVLELYYWESMRSREIAEVLELPEGTVRSRIRRAKQLLEQQLTTLAESQVLLESTASDLEQWAARVKDAVGGAR